MFKMPDGCTEDHCAGIHLPDQMNHSLVIFLTDEKSSHLVFQEILQEDVHQLDFTKESNSHLYRDIFFRKRERTAAV